MLLALSAGCHHLLTLPRHAAQRTHRQHYNLTFAVLVLAGCTFALLQSLVAPALPEIQRDLHTTPTAVAWVLTAYLLSASVLTPIIGRLGDMFGKEHTLVASLGVLGVGHARRGAGDSIEVLIVGRVIQGAGGAVFPLAFGIIRDEFPRERVARGIALMSALLGIGGGAGHHPRRPDRRRALVPLAVLVPADRDGRGGDRDAAVRARVADQDAGAHQLARRRAARRAGSSRAGRRQRGLELGLDERRRRSACSPPRPSLLVAWIRNESRADEPLVDMKMMRIRGVWTVNAAGVPRRRRDVLVVRPDPAVRRADELRLRLRRVGHRRPGCSCALDADAACSARSPGACRSASARACR